MKLQDTLLKHIDITSLLSENCLYKALCLINVTAENEGFEDIRNACKTLIDDYNTQLDSFTKCKSNSEREEIYTHFCQEAYSLNDRLLDALQQKNCPEILYYKKKHTLSDYAEENSINNLLQHFQLEIFEDCTSIEMTFSHDIKSISEQTVALIKKYQIDLFYLFDSIWTNFPATDVDCTIIEQILSADFIDPKDRSLLLSAFFLNLLQWFDEAKVLVLLDCCINDRYPVQIQQQAWVCFTFVSTAHPAQFEKSKRLTQALAHIFQDYQDRQIPLSQTPIAQIQKYMYLIYDSEKIRKKLNSNFLSSADSEDSTDSLIGDDLYDELLYADSPNEDEDLIFIREKQREGADIMLSAFENAKRHAWFHYIYNWFRPFSPLQTSVINLCKQSPVLYDFIQITDGIYFLCETDKNAFFNTFGMMAENELCMLADTFKSKQDELFMTDDIQEEKYKKESYMRNYIHDLYRFFTMSPFCINIFNPFNVGYELKLIKALRPWIDMPTKIDFAKELLKDKNYDESFLLFKHIRNEYVSEEVLRDLAYCAIKKKSKDLHFAEITLLECNRKYPNNAITLETLGKFYLKDKRFDEALYYFKEAQKQEGFVIDGDFCRNIGKAYMLTGKYNAAIQEYYKALTIFEENPENELQIAWLNMILKNMVKACEYIEDAIDNSPQPTAEYYIKGAIIQIQSNNIPQAFKLLKAYLNSFEIDDMLEDIQELDKDIQAAGISKDALSMTIDLICRTQSEE